MHGCVTTFDISLVLRMLGVFFKFVKSTRPLFQESLSRKCLRHQHIIEYDDADTGQDQLNW